MFKLYMLTVDTLSKDKRIMNKVIFGQKQRERHSTKDASFDIFSLANQLY